ncbi:MAG: hypothetical protein WD063_04325 [Pirellulales bacterium]
MQRREHNSGGRFLKPPQHNTVALAKTRRRDVRANKRARGVERDLQLPSVPPEDWHEPCEQHDGYRIVVQQSGPGFRHILTPADVRWRLSQLPAWMLDDLEVVQFSRMTRKKQTFPCYGMQWGASVYLYPIEVTLIECYTCPPTPNQVNEARMYGGRWSQTSPGVWALRWTEESVRDFYLNNILIHELGHLVDARNTGYVAREQYAEWFALEYGFKRSRSARSPKKIVRRHDVHSSRRLKRA